MLGVYKLTVLMLEYSVSEVCYGTALVSKGAAVFATWESKRCTFGPSEEFE